jgi:hypothetical protein
MNIGVEISLYPINADFIPPIQAYIDRINTWPRLRVITNDMSTQVFGAFEDVMPALCVFSMKVLGPFTPGSY